MYLVLTDSIGRKRFTVPCAAYVSHDEDGLVLLEVTGTTTAMEAIWANIVKGRTVRYVVDTEITFNVGATSRRVRVHPQTTYKRQSARSRMLLMHEGMSRYEYRYLIGGTVEEPSPWFQQAVQLRLPFPMLSHWTRDLWRYAVDDNLIMPIKQSYGMTAWKLLATDYFTTKWQKLISTMVRDGVLKEKANG